MIRTKLFKYGFRATALVDIGNKRTSNQDEVILCPDLGFYAVSDGMGGLSGGGKTSQMIKHVLPDMIRAASIGLMKNLSPEYAAELLSKQIKMISDTIYDTGNKGHRFNFGATLSGVWLVSHYAVFVNLGDSRGYLLPRYKKNIRQITKDQNIAAILVEQGEITKEEARNHSVNSNLTHFVGMQGPVLPDIFIREVNPGDRILLCSDGLHGMVNDALLPQLLRSSKSPARVAQHLADEANRAGGKDNIAVIYINFKKTINNEQNRR
jgi:serine/threonine protein phosphatase PrpC